MNVLICDERDEDEKKNVIGLEFYSSITDTQCWWHATGIEVLIMLSEVCESENAMSIWVVNKIIKWIYADSYRRFWIAIIENTYIGIRITVLCRRT